MYNRNGKSSGESQNVQKKSIHMAGRIEKRTMEFNTTKRLKMREEFFFLTFAILAIFASCIRDCRGFSPAMIPRTASNSPPSFSNGITSSRSFSFSFRRNANIFGRRRDPISNSRTRQFAAMSDEAAFLSNDPFIILGLDSPTADKKVLKRAYKKRALKFHPDVVTDIHSTPEEKKKASDRFAKINGAYEQLMGKGKGNGKSGNENDTTSSSSSGGWTPPHRRTGSYKSSSQSSYSEGASTDWKDYMPDYGEDYDTGGDSFGQIFSDIFTGAASAAVSGGIGGVGGGIFNEFLEFLEGGAGVGAGYAGGNEDDPDLRELLKTGTMEEVAEEMDDTEMVVKQLETKSKGLDDEIFALDAEARMSSRFSEKIALEEKGAELKARKDVVSGYLDRARRRLLSLQTRYKDLIAYGGATDDYAASGGRRDSRSSWNDVRDESYSSSSRSSRSSSSYGSRAEPSSTSETEERTNADDDNDDGESWSTEGFGSGRSRGSSRRRGSARRRASSRRTSASSAGVDSNPPSPSPAPSPPPSYSTRETRSGRTPRSPPRTTSTSPSPSRSTSPSTSSMSKSNYSYDVPPHRRTTGSSSFASRQEEDRKRMQEIKVDEEFEKLKKELGL